MDMTKQNRIAAVRSLAVAVVEQTRVLSQLAEGVGDYGLHEDSVLLHERAQDLQKLAGEIDFLEGGD